MSLQIYHNPRCQKSRAALQILEATGKKFEIIEYLKEPITSKTLKDILQKLNLKAEQVVRKNETLWKESYKGQKLTQAKLIKILVENPKLIERPIIIKGKKAIIARPPELAKEMI